MNTLHKFDDAANSLEKLLASLGSNPLLINPEWLQKMQVIIDQVNDDIAMPAMSQLKSKPEVQRYKRSLAEAQAAILLAQQHFSAQMAGIYSDYMRNKNVQAWAESLEHQL